MTEQKPVVAFVHGLPADDGSGRTQRQANLEYLKHGIPLNTLVEVMQDDEYPYSVDDAEGFGSHIGLRMFVAKHYRDFDGEPLYALSHTKNVEEDIEKYKKAIEEIEGAEDYDSRLARGLYKQVLSTLMGSCINGLPEECLKVIRLPGTKE